MKLREALAKHNQDAMPGTKLTLVRCGPDDWYRSAYNDGCVDNDYPVPALLDHEPMVAMARAHWYIQSEPCAWD